MIKLLDFWAEWCIDPQTPILTESGYLQASQIKTGHKVAVLDPKTYKSSLKKVKKVRIFKNAPSQKIVSETGRQLIGEKNHLILTLEGFKKLENLGVEDKILVDPHINTEVYDLDDETIILSSTGHQYADKVLRELDLLPLKINDFRIPILARLLGFVMTDGYLYEDLKHHICETHFSVGTEDDARWIRRDLTTLGFKNLEIKRQVKNRQILNREFTISCLRCRSFSHALFYFLHALGSPIGRKKNQAYFVPDWIMSSPAYIKREFLSGWLGGDGCKIDYRIRHGGTSSHHAGFNVNAIEFHKEKDLEREGILYAKQLAQLFEELGVEVREISSSDDEDGVIIFIRLSHSYPTLLSLAKIGYAYATTKNKNVPFIREFLMYRLFERNRYAQVKTMVLEQLALGVSNEAVANNLQVPLHTVVSWRYTNRDNSIVHPSESGEAIFTKWLENRQQHNLLWERVVDIAEVEARNVIGISVNAPHTIVTNGIVSHNCGPCKFMEPVMEELEKDLAGRLHIEKINVDQNQEMAAKYGVMSIPTYVILRDDKEVERIIGATSKENLVKIISKHE